MIAASSGGNGTMLSALNRLIIRVSASGWLVLASAVVAFACLSAMNRIAAGFPAVAGGATPFDLQNELTAAQVLQQLAGYTDAARSQYFVFTAIDYVFPFAAGLFLAGLSAFALRRAFPGAYAAMVARRLLPLLMLGTLFDWSENIAAVTAMLAWPETTQGMAIALVTAKRLKLTCVLLSNTLALLLLLAAGGRWIAERLRRH
jgi:hypothetical protein